MEYSAFLGLNATTWTAIGTFAALAIALGLTDAVRTLFRRPHLTLVYREFENFSSTINEAYWLRVPIQNQHGKRVAKNVEVFLEAAYKVTSSGRTPISDFVPMRLKWSNTELPSCNMIPSGSFRLLNIGYVELRPSVRQSGDNIQINFPSFVFAGEVTTEAHQPTARGVFELHMSITAEDLPVKQFSARVIIRNRNTQEGTPAKIEDTLH